MMKSTCTCMAFRMCVCVHVRKYRDEGAWWQQGMIIVRQRRFWVGHGRNTVAAATVRVGNRALTSNGRSVWRSAGEALHGGGVGLPCRYNDENHRCILPHI